MGRNVCGREESVTERTGGALVVDGDTGWVKVSG